MTIHDDPIKEQAAATRGTTANTNSGLFIVDIGIYCYCCLGGEGYLFANQFFFAVKTCPKVYKSFDQTQTSDDYQINFIIYVVSAIPSSHMRRRGS